MSGKGRPLAGLRIGRIHATVCERYHRMDLRRIVEEIAGQADDFLAGAADRREARAGIAELLTADYPQLNPADRSQVSAKVMAILEEEGFFETGFGRATPWDESSSGPPEPA